MELADEMMALAKDTQDRGMIMEAYVAPAVTLFYRGDFAACRKLLRRGNCAIRRPGAMSHLVRQYRAKFGIAHSLLSVSGPVASWLSGSSYKNK